MTQNFAAFPVNFLSTAFRLVAARRMGETGAATGRTMKRTAISIFLSLFCLASAFAASPSAAFTLSLLLPQSPASNGPQAAFAKGQAALQNNDLAAAESAFLQVLAADPNSAAAYANLGVIAMRRKDWDLALTNLHKAQKLAPGMTGVRLN